jgi:hypothetical protein
LGEPWAAFPAFLWSGAVLFALALGALAALTTVSAWATTIVRPGFPRPLAYPLAVIPFAWVLIIFRWQWRTRASLPISASAKETTPTTAALGELPVSIWSWSIFVAVFLSPFLFIVSPLFLLLVTAFVVKGGRKLVRMQQEADPLSHRPSLLWAFDQALDTVCADWLATALGGSKLRTGSLRQRAIEYSRWQRAQAVCAAALAFGTLSATAWALLTALARRGLLGDSPWPEIDALIKLSWTFVNAIPLLDLPSTLGWRDLPVQNDLLARIILLAFKVAVVVPIVFFIRDALRARQHQPTDDPATRWGLPREVAEAVRRAIGDEQRMTPRLRRLFDDWRTEAARTLSQQHVAARDDEGWSAALIDDMLRDAARHRAAAAERMNVRRG